MRPQGTDCLYRSGAFTIELVGAGMISLGVKATVNAAVFRDAKDQPYADLWTDFGESPTPTVEIGYRRYNRSVRCRVRPDVDFISPVSWGFETTPMIRQRFRSQDPEDWLVGLLVAATELDPGSSVEDVQAGTGWPKIDEVIAESARPRVPLANCPECAAPLGILHLKECSVATTTGTKGWYGDQEGRLL
jgi:hypothetical protein